MVEQNKTETIDVTDKKFITYLTHKEIRPEDSIRKNGQVIVTYRYNDEFNKAKLDFLVDSNFNNVMSAIKSTEELLRSTK